MNAPLMIAVASRLRERGHRVLRFNFRGTGGSSGRHGYGDAEQVDIDSAVELAASSGLQVGLAGWSFGAATALQWVSSRDSTLPWVGIAPPGDALPEEIPDGHRRIVLGTRDQVVDRTAVQAYAVAMGIDLVLTPGDHFFHGRGKKIGDLVGEGLERDTD